MVELPNSTRLRQLQSHMAYDSCDSVEDERTTKFFAANHVEKTTAQMSSRRSCYRQTCVSGDEARVGRCSFMRPRTLHVMIAAALAILAIIVIIWFVGNIKDFRVDLFAPTTSASTATSLTLERTYVNPMWLLVGMVVTAFLFRVLFAYGARKSLLDHRLREPCSPKKAKAKPTDCCYGTWQMLKWIDFGVMALFMSSILMTVLTAGHGSIVMIVTFMMASFALVTLSAGVEFMPSVALRYWTLFVWLIVAVFLLVYSIELYQVLVDSYDSSHGKDAPIFVLVALILFFVWLLWHSLVTLSRGVWDGFMPGGDLYEMAHHSVGSLLLAAFFLTMAIGLNDSAGRQFIKDMKLKSVVPKAVSP